MAVGDVAIDEHVRLGVGRKSEVGVYEGSGEDKIGRNVEEADRKGDIRFPRERLRSFEEMERFPGLLCREASCSRDGFRSGHPRARVSTYEARTRLRYFTVQQQLIRRLWR